MSDAAAPSITACRICRNSDGNQTYQVREMMFGLLDVFPYVECAQCGCLQIQTIPADMARFYPGKYYSRQPIPHRTAGAWREALGALRNRLVLIGNRAAG